MSRFPSLLLLFLFGTSLFAQQRTAYPLTLSGTGHSLLKLRSEGDTLMYLDGSNLARLAVADTADFVLVNIDIDQLTPYNTGFDEQFAMGLWSTDTAMFMPWDIDTARFMGATSWFTPPGKADNWLVLGPVTIPAGGADLSWYHRHNKGWTDSYELYLSESGPQPYTQIDPDSLAPVFSLSQVVYPDPQPGQDTVWNWETIQLHSFAGKRVFIAFRHTANDGDMLYLDEILVRERNNIGMAENAGPDIEVFPNPTNGILNVYSATDLGTSAMWVSDLLGKRVLSTPPAPSGNSIQIDLDGLEAGIYILTIRNGQGMTSRKIIVE